MLIAKNFNIILFSLIIPGLVFGPFIPNLLLSVVSIICIFKIIKEKKYYYFYNKYFICFLIWCFYLILNSLLSKTPLNSLESSLFYFRFGVFVMAAFYLLENNKKTILYFFYSTLFCLILLFSDSFYQYFNSYNIFQIYNFYEVDAMRLSGLFRDELILGSYFTRIFPLIIFLIISIFENNKKILISLLLLITLITSIIAVISGERVALLYFIVSIFLIGLTYIRNNFLIIFTSFITFISIILIVIFSNSNLKNRIIDKTLIDLDFNNLEKINIFPSSHSDYFNTSIKMFYDNILFGIGPKNYRIECKSEKYIEFNACSTHPHQTYFQLLAETGLIGTIPVIVVFMYFIYIYLQGIIKIYLFNDNQKSTRLKNILSICFIITLLPLIPTGSFFSSWLSVIYYLPIPFYLYLIRNRNNYEK